MNDSLVLFIVFVFFAICIGWNIYNHTSHSKTNGNVLKEDASICDIKTQSVGGQKATTAAIRTTVTFDDGFVYISHKSHTRMDGPLYMTGHISVDSLMLEEIKLDALAAHQKAYRKQFFR